MGLRAREPGSTDRSPGAEVTMTAPLEIVPSTTMREILEAYPAAKVGLFQRYHIGGCQACGYEPTDTLGHVLRTHDIRDPVEKVVETIRASREVEACPSRWRR